MTTYYTGDPVTLTTAAKPFATAGAPTTPADPTAVSITVTDPAGTATTYTWAGATVTRVSAGIFTKTITCTTAGRWHATITGTGTVAKTETVDWDVEAP